MSANLFTAQSPQDLGIPAEFAENLSAMRLSQTPLEQNLSTAIFLSVKAWWVQRAVQLEGAQKAKAIRSKYGRFKPKGSDVEALESAVADMSFMSVLDVADSATRVFVSSDSDTHVVVSWGSFACDITLEEDNFFYALLTFEDNGTLSFRGRFTAGGIVVADQTMKTSVSQESAQGYLESSEPNANNLWAGVSASLFALAYFDMNLRASQVAQRERYEYARKIRTSTVIEIDGQKYVVVPAVPALPVVEQEV